MGVNSSRSDRGIHTSDVNRMAKYTPECDWTLRRRYRCMKLQQVIINQLSDFKPKLYHSDRIAWIEDMEETNEDCLVSLFLSLKCMAANHPVAVFRARAVKSLGKVLFAELRQQAGMQ